MSYAESQQHIWQAEECLRSGDQIGGRREFALAASLQHQFFDGLPSDKVKTRSVYGVSAATLYYRAHHLDEAEQLGSFLLSQPWLESGSAQKLRDLLPRIWDERHLASTRNVLSKTAISVILRGPQILNGLAPPETVDTAMSSIRHYLQRIAAWLQGEPLSRRIPTDLNEKYKAYAAQPVLGSYRMDIYLAGPEQLSLDVGMARRLPEPDEILDNAWQIASGALSRDPTALETLVTNEEYRGNFLRHLRNLVPDGHYVHEVELRRGGADQGLGLVLNENARQPIQINLRASMPEDLRSGQGDFMDGTLRAVDLDSDKLRLDHADGSKTALTRGQDIVDDTLGPFLNKPVRVRVRWAQGRKMPIVIDIDRREGEEESGGGRQDDRASNMPPLFR